MEIISVQKGIADYNKLKLFMLYTLWIGHEYSLYIVQESKTFNSTAYINENSYPEYRRQSLLEGGFTVSLGSIL